MNAIINVKITFCKYLHFCKYENILEKIGNLMKNKEVLNGHNRGKVLAQACPSREILRHLTSRWGVLVLIVLQNGTKRFSEIRREIEGVSERMLTQTLQQLEQDGMVHRQDFQTVPPHVEYSLTDWGQQASDKVADLVEWLEVNLNEILITQNKNIAQD